MLLQTSVSSSWIYNTLQTEQYKFFNLSTVLRSLYCEELHHLNDHSERMLIINRLIAFNDLATHYKYLLDKYIKNKIESKTIK